MAHHSCTVVSGKYLINQINKNFIYFENNFLFFKKSMSIDSENPLLIEVLSGSSTSYTYKPTDQIVDVSKIN